eukprot:6052010-Prorocentrum_lima.AAC.1
MSGVRHLLTAVRCRLGVWHLLTVGRGESGARHLSTEESKGQVVGNSAEHEGHSWSRSLRSPL